MLRVEQLDKLELTQKPGQLEFLARLTRLTDQPFRALAQPVLVLYLNSGPRFSNPATFLGEFDNLARNLGKFQLAAQTQLSQELEQARAILEKFFYSPAREEGLMLLVAEWAGLAEVLPLTQAPKNQLFYDCYLHLEVWLNLTGQSQAEILGWVRREAVAQRQGDPDFLQKLGYGVLDLQHGDWFSDHDIAAFARPEHNAKYYVRALLKMLGKRFPDALAPLVWAEINCYQIKQNQGKSFEEAAQEWYKRDSTQFIKNWYFSPDCPEHHYLAGGHEWEPGTLFKFSCRKFPVLERLGRAGFNFRQIRRQLATDPAFSWRGLRGQERFFWPWLLATLNEFELSSSQLEQITLEIEVHAQKLNLFTAYPAARNLACCEAAIDYFRRLELAGLGAEAICP